MLEDAIGALIGAQRVGDAAAIGIQPPGGQQEIAVKVGLRCPLARRAQGTGDRRLRGLMLAESAGPLAAQPVRSGKRQRPLARITDPMGQQARPFGLLHGARRVAQHLGLGRIDRPIESGLNGGGVTLAPDFRRGQQQSGNDQRDPNRAHGSPTGPMASAGPAPSRPDAPVRPGSGSARPTRSGG